MASSAAAETANAAKQGVKTAVGIKSKALYAGNAAFHIAGYTGVGVTIIDPCLEAAGGPPVFSLAVGHLSKTFLLPLCPSLANPATKVGKEFLAEVANAKK
jgi:hypothetical protein